MTKPSTHFALAALAGLVTVVLVAASQILSAGAAEPRPGKAVPALAKLETAIFAGGCFWCVETDFDKVEGVTDTQSGYTGGWLTSPSYRDVVKEDTGHYEAVKVTYDPARVSYETLVDHFFRHVDPTDAGGQFCDRGDSYRTAIFVADPAQKATAEAVKTRLDRTATLPGPIVTPILDAQTFWPAEAYHQNYAYKNPVSYRFYRFNCGRDARVKAVWGK
jgi:peptide-methionine (S)-S-oxide reductase